MIRGMLILICVSSIPGLCGCRSNGLSTASNSNTSAPLFGGPAKSRQDSSELAQNSKSGLGSRSVGFGKSKSPDVKTAGMESRQSGRAPTVKPAVHSSEPDPEIPAGEAATAAQPQGNFLSRMLPGNKEPGKRMPLPLAEVPSSQSSSGDLFGGP